jgi:RNA polymerase sigma-70 factor (ECF subfamily)
VDFSDFFLCKIEHVVGAVALVTRDVGAAEDAAQEAFHRAYRRWNDVGTLARPELWVIRVATNLAVDAYRKKRNEREIADNQTLPSHLAEADELIGRQWLQYGLDQLNPRQRAAFVMHVAEGQPFADIAGTLGTSTGAVRQHVSRARKTLRRLWSADQSL